MKHRLALLLIAVLIMVNVSACKKKEEAPAAAPKAAEQAKGAETAPVPSGPPVVQKAVVAGQFYPADKSELQSLIKKSLDQAEPEALVGKPFGFMVPHAGYIYSGPVAAYVYKTIGKSNVKRFVIMAPSHHVGFQGVYAMDKDFYETPLGQVKIDRASIKKLLTSRQWISADDALYDSEHSLEVQIPFLQTVVGKDLLIVPLVLGQIRLDMAQRLAAALDEVFKGQPVIYIASTDMAHGNYQPFRDASKINAIDNLTLSRINNMDIQTLEKDLDEKNCELCGAGPVLTLMTLFRMSGGKNVKVLKYGDSGDSTGDKSQVVGYGAVAFMLEEKAAEVLPKPEEQKQAAEKKPKLLPPQNYSLTAEEKKELLALARKTVEAAVKGEALPDPAVNSKKLTEQGAAFVTLTEHGQLRGCIGHIIAIMPLNQCIQQVARSAALEDPRFPRVVPQELPLLEYEISILTAPELVKDLSSVTVGRDGLIMESGMYRGVLLPQVPVENDWDRDTFLSQTCRKAGMGLDCWKNPEVTVKRFQALVFNEKE